MLLDRYSRKICNKNTVIVSFNFRESNFNKVKKARINLSALINDSLSNTDPEVLMATYPKGDTIDYKNEKRVVSSVSINEGNVDKVKMINIGLLIDNVLDEVEW